MIESPKSIVFVRYHYTSSIRAREKFLHFHVFAMEKSLTAFSLSPHSPASSPPKIATSKRSNGMWTEAKNRRNNKAVVIHADRMAFRLIECRLFCYVFRCCHPRISPAFVALRRKTSVGDIKLQSRFLKSPSETRFGRET